VPLTIQKTWTNAIVNDAATVSTSGGTNNASLPSVANTANETDAATPVQVAAGDVITISEAFDTGSATNYDATLSCSGNANALVGNVLTVSNTDTAITCTYTNARKAVSLALAKAWQNATGGDAMEDVPSLTRLIADLNADGVTICMVEHHMHVVLGLAHRIAVLHHGRLLAVGTPAEVTADPEVRRAYLGDSL
jgi:hypothetical protein